MDCCDFENNTQGSTPLLMTAPPHAGTLSIVTLTVLCALSYEAQFLAIVFMLARQHLRRTSIPADFATFTTSSPCL